jgi:hypothetical protein
MADGRPMKVHFLNVGETMLLSPIEETAWVTMILSPKAGETIATLANCL